eukprot:scaffold81830_cov42-Phaeocystis_antarctica.AAC.1
MRSSTYHRGTTGGAAPAQTAAPATTNPNPDPNPDPNTHPHPHPHPNPNLNPNPSPDPSSDPNQAAPALRGRTPRRQRPCLMPPLPRRRATTARCISRCD